MVRLFLNVVDLEEAALNGPHTTYIARAINVRWGDEKGCEDVHQRIRDIQRSRRHPGINMQRIYYGQIQSGVLERRHENVVQVGTKDLASVSWRSRNPPSMRRDFRPPPNGWHRSLNDILGKRLWPSPTVPGYWKAICAWMWLRAFFEDGFSNRGTKLGDAWLARLVPCQVILVKPDMEHSVMVLASGKWGLVVVDTEKIAENTWQLSRCADAIHWLFVVTPGDWMVQKVVPDVHKCIGVVFVGDGEPDSLIRAALLRTHPIATPYLRRLHDLLAPEDVEPVSKRRFNLLAEVCGLAFPESSDIADNVLAEYKNVTLNTKTKTMEIDDETADAVEILAGQEGINASDIQEVRDTIKKSVLRQIKAQRSVQLKKKAAAKAARKKKKEEKKSAGVKGPLQNEILPGQEMRKASCTICSQRFHCTRYGGDHDETATAISIYCIVGDAFLGDFRSTAGAQCLCCSEQQFWTTSTTPKPPCGE